MKCRHCGLPVLAIDWLGMPVRLDVAETPVAAYLPGPYHYGPPYFELFLGEWHPVRPVHHVHRGSPIHAVHACYITTPEGNA